MKRMAAALALCLAVAMVGGCGSGQSQTAVSVESVANITGMGNVGITDKFSGLVVSQEEVKIQKNADMTVKELKEGGCKVSLRTDAKRLNASDVCARFGGGGHPAAAGCMIPGTPKQVRDALLEAIEAVRHG